MTVFLLRLVQICHLLFAVVFSLLAIGAGLGFANPLLDSLNHLQLLWFFGTLALLLMTAPLYVAYRLRAALMALTATGFLASAIIVIPEALSAFLPQDALPQDGRPVYRIVTYNMFGMNYSYGDVYAMIEDEDPDILAFQEYFPEQRAGLDKVLSATYPYSELCTGPKRTNIAIYAKLPFTTDSGGDCNSLDNGRTAQLIAHFTPEAAPAFDVMTTQLDWPVQISQWQNGSDIGDRIARMTARQQNQFAELAGAVEKVNAPLILVGDFNSTPWSYTLRNFVREAGLNRRTHNLWTYPKLLYFDQWRKTPAFLPLDQVMTKNGVAVHDVQTGRPAGSDHLPVVVDFSVDPSQVPSKTILTLKN